MFVHKLRMTVPTKEHAEIIEPSDNTLKFHAIDQEDCHRDFLLPDMVEKHILKVLRFFWRHFEAFLFLIVFDCYDIWARD